MVRQGQLGRVRLVVVEFSHGHHAAGDDPDNPRIRWRYDPRQVGNSAQFADCGSHALHLASFVTGRQVERLSADFASCVPGRELEDDAMVAFRMQDGIVGRLWTSAVAVGRQHGLTLQVSGERGGLRWQQEQANQLYWCPVGGRVTVIERGEASLSADAERASRIAVGHVEGVPLAFANVYADLYLDRPRPGRVATTSSWLPMASMLPRKAERYMSICFSSSLACASSSSCTVSGKASNASRNSLVAAPRQDICLHHPSSYRASPSRHSYC